MRKSDIGRTILVFATAFSVVLPSALAFASNPSKQIEASGEAAYVQGMTAGRARSLAGGVLGLLSVIIGLRAKVRRSSNSGTSRRLSITGIIMGIVSVILSIVHLAFNMGDFGTGGGKAGAIAGLLLGLIGGLLGALAFRKTPTQLK